MARDFEKAEKNLEVALQKDPSNKKIRRKLIICHTQTGHIDAAMDKFLSLIKEDADFIIDTDPIADDCPCPELVFDLENKLDEKAQSARLNIVMGMLWLFCSLDRSIHYFESALALKPDDSTIKSILTFLKARPKNKLN